MRVLIVVARRYNGHELWTTLGTLQERGHEFEVISTQTRIMDEVTGQPNIIKRTLDDVSSIEDFEALMFVSGDMADTEAYWKDKRTLAYVEQAMEMDIPIAAICCSVPIIRHAAKGKKVSLFPLVRSKEILEREGAILQTVAMTVDGTLVTAEHQMATQMWAEAFCDVLDGKEPEVKLYDSGFEPRGNERKPIPELEHLKDVINRTGRTGTKDGVSSK